MSSIFQPQWSSAPLSFTLPVGEVHIWRASLDLAPLQIQAFVQTLTTDELQRAERFRFEHDRRRFIAGRGTLRAILGRYLNLEPAQIRFRYEASGKPTIAPSTPHSPPPTPYLQFNLSHSHELMVCAITQTYPVGIDLEHLRPITDLEGLTRRFFSEREHLAIQQLPEKQQMRSFFQHWTCKEALLKATGDGLIDLSKIEVAIAGGKASLTAWAEKNHLPDHWSLHPFTPDPNYIAALAVKISDLAEPEPLQMIFWNW
ncbi:4'-phosphopantetheinyl transferase superfamily protein [Kovacikia minuta CCNUW1]|uniref:4'-phosphopantetheinyl transferase family protein n=1 Tax=Kovacikia minuta TaxID=2931930 RepID=UPI001CCF8C37|nr:4'-phosphopantetheinyl transferase superfamily protein [Kovacikia minuta]UBF27771.1 4'-phosphopantetheinyl transferase superfamily protein [Kovacikia minuta CCNUW1]